jgi:hypothetical protein
MDWTAVRLSSGLAQPPGSRQPVEECLRVVGVKTLAQCFSAGIL